MSNIWQAGDRIPSRYHDLGDEVSTPPLNLSRLTRTQRNALALSLHKDVIADSIYAIDHSPAAHVRRVLAGVFGDYNRSQVTKIEYGSHNRTLAMLHDYCGQSLVVQSGLIHLMPREVAKSYLEKFEGHTTWRQRALEYCSDIDGFGRFTNGRFMENLAKLEFETTKDVVERVKCLYGYGEKAETEAYTFVNGLHNVVPMWGRAGFNPYGPSGTTFSSDLWTTTAGLVFMTTIILGLQSSQSNYKHWASKKPNKEARFVSTAAQKLASNSKRRQFFLLGVRHNLVNIGAVFACLQFGLLYPLLSMDSTYQASLVPGLMTLPCYHFLSTMKRAEQSISISQMVRLMPTKLLHTVPLVAGFSLLVNYVNARRLFDAKLSLHHNLPVALAGSDQNKELVEELIAKNDFYMEDPLEKWKISYLLGYKEIDRPEIEGYWRRRPKQGFYEYKMQFKIYSMKCQNPT